MSDLPPLVVNFIDQKHDEYIFRTRMYEIIYFTLRVAVCLGTLLLPFFIHSQPGVATTLSVVVCIATGLDVVFNPKDRWRTYSKATDLITVEKLKLLNQYERYKDLIDAIMRTESAKVEQLQTMEEVLSKIRELRDQSTQTSTE